IITGRYKQFSVRTKLDITARVTAVFVNRMLNQNLLTGNIELSLLPFKTSEALNKAIIFVGIESCIYPRVFVEFRIDGDTQQTQFRAAEIGDWKFSGFGNFSGFCINVFYFSAALSN